MPKKWPTGNVVTTSTDQLAAMQGTEMPVLDDVETPQDGFGRLRFNGTDLILELSDGTEVSLGTDIKGKLYFTAVVGNSLAGDGVDDVDFLDPGDGTGIQAALNALPAGGGTVMIRRGTYALAGTTITRNLSNLRIIGEGKGATKITGALGGVGMFVFGDGVSNFSNLEISHLTIEDIDSGLSGGEFFSIRRYDDVNIHDCEFEGNNRNGGLRAFNFGFSPQSKIQFTHNVFRNLGFNTGVIRVSGSHTDFIFNDNIVQTIGALFISLESSTRSIIKNNHFDNSIVLDGIAIKVNSGGSRVIIEGNIFTRWILGIDLDNGDEVMIEGNFFDICTTAIEVAVLSTGAIIQNNKTLGVTNDVLDLASGTIIRDNSWQHGFIDIDVDDTPFTAVDDEVIRADTTIGTGSPADITINLPAAARKFKQSYTIKKNDSGANTVTIDPNAAETIDDQLTVILSNPFETVKIQSDGTNWTVVSG